MNISERQNKLIEKYLDKSLSEKQSGEFQEALKEDSFRDQLLFQARIYDASNDIRGEQLRAQLNTIPKQKLKQPLNRRNLFLLIGIIVIYLSFLLTHKFLQPDATGKEIFAEYFVEVPPEVNNRGSQDQQNEDYLTAMQHYIDKDYRTALLAFDQLEKSSDDIQLYKAMCQLQLDEMKMAKMSLMALLKSDEKYIRQNANWYLILLSVKESDFIKAHESLGYVVQNEGHLFRKQAIKLKAALEDWQNVFRTSKSIAWLKLVLSNSSTASSTA